MTGTKGASVKDMRPIKQGGIIGVLVVLALLASVLVAVLRNARREPLDSPTADGPKADSVAGDERDASPVPNGTPSHPERALPPPSSDIIAMLDAMTPIVVTRRQGPQPKAITKELETIRRRYEQGDRREALRLYADLADRYPGTPAAASALFEVAYASSLERKGEIALRLANETPTHHLTVRALNMFLKESLRAMGVEFHSSSTYSGPLEARPPVVVSVPGAEAGRRALPRLDLVPYAAAVLAGRYPDDPRGPECLLGLAMVLALYPETSVTAIDLCKLLAAWPNAWDVQFLAHKKLHDDALKRGDLAAAQKQAEQAAMTCGGRTCVDHRRRSMPGAGDEPETPWQKMLANGIPSAGKVLLPAPTWEEGTCVTLAVERDDPLAADGEPAICIAESLPTGLHLAVASGRFWRADARPELTLVGDPQVASAHGTSPLFLPKFPVREGAEIFPCRGIGLVRQDAQQENETVVVSILAGSGTVWRQTWLPGQPWWDEAGLRGEKLTYGGATLPRPYDSDPGWYMRKFILHIKRARGSASASAALDIERKALDALRPGWLDDRLRRAVTTRLPKLFTGEKLEQMQTKWRSDSQRPAQPSDSERTAELAAAASLLASDDPSGALKKLEARECWGTLQHEAMLLRAQALLGLANAREAAEILRCLPWEGSHDRAKALQLESRAWEECEVHVRALSAAEYLLASAPGAPEAAEAKRTVEQLAEHGDALRQAREANPCFDFRWRSGWPQAGGAIPCETRPYLYGRVHNRSSANDVQFGRKNGLILAKEGDRLVAKSEGGTEVWRYTVAPELPDAPSDRASARPGSGGPGLSAQRPEAVRRDRLGLSHIADPHLVTGAHGDRVICGVGHRTVSIGMGLWYGPIGGGVLVIDLGGKRVYEKEVAYCEALAVVPGKGRSTMAVGLFLKPDRAGERWKSSGEWFVAGYDVKTGNELWWAPLLHREQHYRRWRQAPPLSVAASRDGSQSIVVSLGSVWTYSLRGERTGQIEGAEVDLIADFDSDGTDELVVCRRARAHDTGGELSIVNLKGNTLWQAPPGSWAACAVRDLDGDGWKELLASGRSPCYARAVFGRAPGSPEEGTR